MSRPTGTVAAAQRRRRKHEQRIAQTINPLGQLAQAYAWLRAEAGRVPHLIPDAVTRVTAIAAALNDPDHDRKGDPQ